MQVCERHFKPEHLRTISTYTDGDGRPIEIPTKLTLITSDAIPAIFPGITSDAVPAIFPDCPSYLSSTKQSREEPDAKRRNSESGFHTAIQQSTAAYEKEEANNKLENLEDFSSRFYRFHSKSFWMHVSCDNCIIFAHLEPTTQAPELLASVTVSADMCACALQRYTTGAE